MDFTSFGEWVTSTWRSWIRASWYNYENNQQDVLYWLIYYSKSALHVSGDVFAHDQEHLTVFTVSGSVHPSFCRLVSHSGHQPAATWVKHRPKHVQPVWNNKLTYIVHLVGYFYSWVTAIYQPKFTTKRYIRHVDQVSGYLINQYAVSKLRLCCC